MQGLLCVHNLNRGQASQGYKLCNQTDLQVFIQGHGVNVCGIALSLGGYKQICRLLVSTQRGAKSLSQAFNLCCTFNPTSTQLVTFRKCLKMRSHLTHDVIKIHITSICLAFQSLFNTVAELPKLGKLFPF